MMRETYKATIGAVELTRGKQLLLFAASVVLFVVGFIVADAAIELGRLLFVPDLPAGSGWLAFAFFVLIVLVLTAISTLWERFQPGPKSTLRDLPAGFEKNALVAQRVAKKQRVKGIIGIDGCRVFRWPDGQRYEGTTSDGKQHGFGVHTWTNGTRYEGEWKKGRRHGYGVIVAPDGSQMLGRWKDDQRLDDDVGQNRANQ
jgi:hypothetical protein